MATREDLDKAYRIVDDVISRVALNRVDHNLVGSSLGLLHTVAASSLVEATPNDTKKAPALTK